MNAHENDVLAWLVILEFLLHFAVEGLQYQIGLQIIQNLVIAKVAVFRQVQNGLIFDDFIVFVVEHFNYALSDEVHLLNIAFVADDSFVCRGDAAVHINNKFIRKTALTLFKKVAELSFKIPEKARALD